jgi:hypothetical protein
VLVTGLAAWLRAELAASGESELRVLELGAGAGCLARHLQAALAGSAVRLSASDSFERGLAPVAGVEVRRLDHRAALSAEAAHVVIVAFMPLGRDWTAEIRACPTVRAYVLLGETDDGCCGRPWPTWGYLADGDDDACGVDVPSTSGESGDGGDSDDHGDGRGDGSNGDGDGAEDGGRGRPFEADPERWRRVYEFEAERTVWGAAGWERSELSELSRGMLCCTDVPWSSTRHARAVLFRRKSR